MSKVHITNVVAGLAAITIGGAALAQDAAPKINRIGLNINFVETDETAYGVVYQRDVTDRDRLFITIETYEFKNSDQTTTRNYLSTWESTVEGEEVEVGYLRRLSQPGATLGIFAGASVGVQFDEGTFEDTETDWTGTYIGRGKIESDPAVNLYANIMGEYIHDSGVGVFGMFSYGYGLGSDTEYKYSTGSQPTITVDGDSSTFWNFALGAVFAF